jgi:hypothetical protein
MDNGKPSKLSRAMRGALEQLAVKSRRESAWNGTMQALRRRGYVEMDIYISGTMRWSITESGRQALLPQPPESQS